MIGNIERKIEFLKAQRQAKLEQWCDELTEMDIEIDEYEVALELLAPFKEVGNENNNRRGN
jgi:hypothetical protein